jgi:hypothetical protein
VLGPPDNDGFADFGYKVLIGMFVILGKLRGIGARVG